jgi:hypothetical protein
MAVDNSAPNRLRLIVTPYRMFVTVALTAAALLMVFGFQSSKDQSKATCGGGAIVRLIPCPGDSGLGQGLIGVDLDSAYTGVLQVDGTEIPQDQYRTGGPSQVYFQPGPGTETGALRPGRHAAVVIYWPVNSDRTHSATFSWTFTTS